VTGPLEDVAEHWPVASSDYPYREWVVALRVDTVEMGDTSARRLALEHPGAVVVIAVDEQDRVFCLWQYRHAAAHRFVELPAGLLDGPDDEQPLDVARRELREEAELEAAEWTHLSSTYPSPGISAEVHHLFLARDLSPVSRGDFELHHEEADMTTGWVPFADLHAAVVAGRVTDGPTALAVLLAAARGVGRGIGSGG
jgi:8-oxo-dGDP phosphatase